MKSVMTTLLVSASMISAVYAYDDSPYRDNGEPNYRYESYTGTKYQYDLSDPMDRIDYSLDLDAQMRDRINPNPMIDMDQDMGQIGGGAEW